MIWRPTGVEPVNDTTSTSGCVVSSAPTARIGRGEHVHDAGRDVGGLGDELAERERRPRRVGRALQHDGAAGRERRRELRERELDGVVVRGDRADDAGRLLLDPAVVAARERVALAEVLDEVVALEEIGVPAPRRRSGPRAAARSCSRPARRPRARGSRCSASKLSTQRLVELAQAPHAERVVARPVGGVEGAPGGGDRAGAASSTRRVGGHAEHVFGRGVDVLVGRAALGRRQLAVDQQLLFVPDQFAPRTCTRRPLVPDR